MQVHMLRSARLSQARAFAALLAVSAAVAVVPGSAAAGPVQHHPDDPWFMTEPCDHDTSPSYPSCAGAASLEVPTDSGAGKVQYWPHDPWFMTEPCKHDTSPSFPSCGGTP